MSSVVCAVCTAPAPLKCSACQVTAYCTKEHQKQHWKTHKAQCKAYEVRTTPELGGHLVATRDVPPDGVLLTEAPLALGPRHHDTPPAVCLGCLRALGPAADLPAYARCNACLWPACSPDCAGLTDPHRHAAECRVLQAGRHVLIKGDLRYEPLMPLRCLLLQKTSPAKWKTLLSMKAHMDERRPGSAVYQETEERIVSYLRDNFLIPLSAAVSGSNASKDSVEGLLEDCSTATLHRIVGVLDVNALEICTPGADLSALFPTAYLMEHSCVPNTRHTFESLADGEGDARCKITVRAAVAVNKGDHISTMYTHILWGTLARREHLRAVKTFACSCRRCSDPRELGTLLSALRCLTCSSGGADGWLLPTNPLQDDADWRCDSCGALLGSEHAIQIVASLDEQVGNALYGQPGAPKLEEVVTKLEKLLHPQHYHCLQVKHSLLQLYGNQPGLEMDKLSEQQLQRKAALCRSMLPVLLALDPALARLQLYASVCLLELQRAELEQLKRGLACGASGSGAGVPAGAASVQDLRSLLLRAQTALRYESPGTDGARMAAAVLTALQELDIWARFKKLPGA